MTESWKIPKCVRNREIMPLGEIWGSEAAAGVGGSSLLGQKIMI